jgi:molecular chaperone DnaK
VWRSKVGSAVPVAAGGWRAPADPAEGFGKGRAIGIDFGTTNSAVVVLEGGEPTVIRNGHGVTLTPSVVGFPRNGNAVVGEVAKRQAVLLANRTVSAVKRKLGTDWSIEIDGHTYSAEAGSRCRRPNGSRLLRPANGLRGHRHADSTRGCTGPV